MTSGGLSEEAGLEAGEGDAGEAQRRQIEELASLDEQAPMSEEELDARQERFSTERRHGGPDLNEETEAREEAMEDVPDVPPTETSEASEAKQ
jgi:hypothetical protein